MVCAKIVIYNTTEGNFFCHVTITVKGKGKSTHIFAIVNPRYLNRADFGILNKVRFSNNRFLLLSIL